MGIQELCESAAITKPTLYYHFGNKEGLLRASVEYAVSTFLSGISGFLAVSDDTSRSDLLDEIGALLDGVYRFAHREQTLFQLIVQALYAPLQSTLKVVAHDSITGMIQAFTDYFRRLSENHGNLGGKEEYVALVFLSHSVIYSQYERTNDSHARKLASQTFLYGVF